MRRSARSPRNGNQDAHDRFPLWLPLGPVKKACRDRQASSVSCYFCDLKSGRWDSNPRRPAWEAGILPTELRPQTVPENLPARPKPGNDRTTPAALCGWNRTMAYVARGANHAGRRGSLNACNSALAPERLITRLETTRPRTHGLVRASLPRLREQRCTRSVGVQARSRKSRVQHESSACSRRYR